MARKRSRDERCEATEEEEEAAARRFFACNANGANAYSNGKPYSFEMRQRILHAYDCSVPGDFRNETARRDAVAQQWSVSLSVISKYVNLRDDLLSDTGSGWLAAPEHVSAGARPQIQACALDVLEALVVQFNGNKSIKFFTDSLNTWLQTDFSEAAVRHAFRRLGLSRRLMNKVDPRKWSPFNQAWRCQYLTETRLNCSPFALYFMDECHVENGRYRHAWWYRGEKCYIQEKHRASAETLTINAIIGLSNFSNGLPVVWDYVDHQKDGPSDGNTFISFINSFAQFLPHGSTLIMDNCKFHRYEAGAVAEYLLSCWGVRLVYLSPYSPELNPIENAFNVFKFYLRRSEFTALLDACHDAWTRITLDKAYGFYQGCGYLPEL